LRLGASPGSAVLVQKALLHQAQASEAALKKQLSQQHNLVAVLVGTIPAELPELKFQLSSLQLPDIPTALPAKVIEQRPDVRVAKAQLRAANAGVGVAVSNMLPQINLTASYGNSAQELSQLFNASGIMWSIGAGVVQPLFQGGALLHRKRAAEAQLDQALALYEQSILLAFQNVADTLEAASYDAQQYIATKRQEVTAHESLKIAQRQLELGDISVIVLLNSESVYLQSSIARIQTQSGRFNDVVAMYQALGGGWGNAQSTAQVSKKSPSQANF
jgi:NodT family efflux transporter outer membrane factor (OMF) lipoprotein